MDTEKHYVIQTDNDETNYVIENNTILVCSEDGEQTEYVPYAIENGQIILKRINEIEEPEMGLENFDSNEIIVTSNEKLDKDMISKQQRSRYYSKVTQQRRKLSYQTDFKPCSLPSNRGGMKGLIRYGRKHLIIDQQIMISPREFKQQLNDTNDLIMTAEVAPSTKQKMRHVLTGITRLFAYPAHKMPNNKLLQLYVSNCTSKKTKDEEIITDMELKPLGYKVEVDTSKIKRITRKRKYPEAEEYLKQQALLQIEKNKDETLELVKAAKLAENDHSYTERKDIENVFVEPIKEESQIFIMQTVDDNDTLNNIEVLLAAAETSEEVAEYQQIEEIEESEDSVGQKIYFVQEGTNEIICLPEEYILS